MVDSVSELHSVRSIDVEVGTPNEDHCDHCKEEEVTDGHIFRLVGVAETQAHPFLKRNKRISVNYEVGM